MMRATGLALLLAATPGLARGQSSEAAAPGTSEGTFELSWSHFERFYGNDGEARSLDDAFDPGTRGVTIDALQFRFGGRYVLGPGFEVGVDVPLVRLTRTGETETLLGDESLYAEAMQMGDVTGNARLEIPLGMGDLQSAFGVTGTVKAPTGTYEKIESNQIPTGGGDWGLGGELFALVRPGYSEVGAGAGLMLLLPHRRDGVEVDRGDVRTVRVWAVAPLGPRARVGATLWALMREADRVEGDAVESLAGGAQPGTLVPASRLLTLGPFVEVSPARGTRLVVSLNAPTSSWLFVPGEAGWSLSGENVMVSGTQLHVAFRAGF